MVRGIGTRVFYVTTGGFDTHSAQNPNAVNGSYYNLMATLNDALFAFYTDLTNQGLLGDTLVLSFSEFGRRISENGSNGTDHGAASVMLAMGGRVNGGLYGTAPNLNTDPANPTLENSAGRRAVRDRLPLGLRAGDRLVARRRFARDSQWRLPQRGAHVRVTRGQGGSGRTVGKAGRQAGSRPGGRVGQEGRNGTKQGVR